MLCVHLGHDLLPLGAELRVVVASLGTLEIAQRDVVVLALALVEDAHGLGAPVEEIARRASLSPGTVRNYLSAAVGKVGAANRHEAARIARSYGWI